MTKHLLVDFGEVISVAQPVTAMRAMAAFLEIPIAQFPQRYWAPREEYDRGSDARDYWEEVAGRPVRGAELAEIRRLDLESWTHLNFATITALREAHRAGARLTLLSNAPHDLAGEVRRIAAITEIFSLLLFSAELRLVKPSAAIFELALAVTESRPEDTLFIDDREDNIAAARACGLRTHRFTSATALAAELEPLNPAPRGPRGLQRLWSRTSGGQS